MSQFFFLLPSFSANPLISYWKICAATDLIAIVQWLIKLKLLKSWNTCLTFLIQLSGLTSISCRFQGFGLEAKTSHYNLVSVVQRFSLIYGRAPISHYSSWRGQRAVEGKSVSRGTVKFLADALFGVVWLVGSGQSIMPGSTGCCVKWFVMTVYPVSVFMFHRAHTTQLCPSVFPKIQVFGLQAVVSSCLKTGHGSLSLLLVCGLPALIKLIRMDYRVVMHLWGAPGLAGGFGDWRLSRWWFYFFVFATAF